MTGHLRLLALVFMLFTSFASAEHVIVTGGPALRKWENYRVTDDQHDRFWGNFVRASTLRMVEIRKAYGSNAPIVWMVYRPAYTARGREDGKPYTSWITDLAAKRSVTLIWVDSGGGLISSINSRPRGSVETFDFFGHSNRHAFLLDYGNDIMAASTAWLHENDLSRLKGSVFTKNAYCKSWGCHTGESMSKVWRSTVGNSLEGAKGPTTYTTISEGKLPEVHGSWVR